MNTPVMSSASLHRLLEGSYETIYEEVCTALKAAGFEIVAEIDMAELLEKKSPSYVRPYKIVIVFDSDIAHRVLTVAPTVTTILPCHVTILQTEDNQIEVKVTDPHALWNTTFSRYLEPIVEELSTRLERVVKSLKK